MSELIVIGSEDAATARQAYRQVLNRQQDFVVDLRGLAMVDVDADGKTHVDTPRRIVGSSAMTGALFGMLLGLLFFVPGMILLGGALGALFGKLNRSGIDSFRTQVEHMLEPGHSAEVIMASKITEDKFATAMQPFGGTILKTSRSEADEKELAEELALADGTSGPRRRRSPVQDRRRRRLTTTWQARACSPPSARSRTVASVTQRNEELFHLS